jgi:hypothetical protein
LAEINSILAFCPWNLTLAHIEELVKGEKDPHLRYSIPELLSACAIMATYHSLCGLVFGQGIKENIDITMWSGKASKSSVDTGKSGLH